MIRRGPDPSNPGGAQFGKYRIIGKLGEGAFGGVYEAVVSGQMGFSKRVAIKKLHPHLVEQDPRFVQSMANEARIGGLLHHANIVDINEFDDVDGQYYFAMEYVDGLTLSQIIGLCRKQGVLLPSSTVIGLAIQVCRGLHYAHQLTDEQGRPLCLVHRDLKPSNIIVDAEGTAKILDFGIAKATSNLAETTLSATVKGTPRYMSPEQTEAEPVLSPRTDIYSLGAVLFELITTHPLVEGDSLPAVVRQIALENHEERLQQAEGMLPGSARVLERALCRDPAERYSDARAMAGDLRELGRSFPVEQDIADVIRELMPRVDRTTGDDTDGVLPAATSPPATPGASGTATTPGRGRVWAGIAIGIAVAALVAVGWATAQRWVRAPDPGVAPSTPDPSPTSVASTELDQPPGDAPELALDPLLSVAGEQGGAPDEDSTSSAATPAPPEPGTFSLYSRPWADVYVDGELVISEARIQRVPIEGGRHEIKLVCTARGGIEKVFLIEVDGQDMNLGCWDFDTDASCGP